MTSIDLVVSKNTNELKTGSSGRFVINVSTLGWGMSRPLLNLVGSGGTCEYS